MEKQIFKVGDEVYDFEFGYGTVADISRGGFYNIKVNFETKAKTIYFTRDGKYEHGDEIPRLSFTEYDLINGGFSQEKPVNYEKYVGKWGKFWDSNKDILVIGKLLAYDTIERHPFENEFEYYANFEPLTEEQIKVLGL